MITVYVNILLDFTYYKYFCFRKPRYTRGAEEIQLNLLGIFKIQVFHEIFTSLSYYRRKNTLIGLKKNSKISLLINLFMGSIFLKSRC